MKINKLTLLAPLMLAGVSFSHADSIVPNGSGVYFYGWNANQYCDSSKHSCPEKWVKTLADVNAKIPTDSKGKINYIYLDSMAFTPQTLSLSQTAFNAKTSFTVGGCSDTTADISFCSSTSMDYVQAANKAIDGATAVSDLKAALANADPNTTYHIIPMFSYAPNTLMSGTVPEATLNALAQALATAIKGSGAAGIGFDIEAPNLSGPTKKGPNAAIFYKALATDLGAGKIIMISRGPGNLTPTDNPQLIANIKAANSSSSDAHFIFAPQVYDACDGMGNPTTGWACPIATPPPIVQAGQTNKFKWDYYYFSQQVPNTTMPLSPGETPISWVDQWAPPTHPTDHDTPIYEVSMAFQFQHQLANVFAAGVPVQLIMSGGGSSQIWTHVNLYGATTGTNYYDKSSGVTNLDQIYTNPQPCQSENPDGTLGTTIAGCLTYQNPYSSGLSDYASAFFNAVRFWTNNSQTPSQNAVNSPLLVGLGIYPFTPYGYFDKDCPAKMAKGKTECAGFYPEVPDGLVNGQKPKFSFWTAYVNQFANQPMALNGTGASAQAPVQFNLNQGYYSLNQSTDSATVTFSIANQAAVSPTGYRAQLLDALGNEVAESSNCQSTTCDIPKVPAGNYILRIQALNGPAVMGSIEAAAPGSGVTPPPTGPLKITDVSVASVNGSAQFTLSYTGGNSTLFAYQYQVYLNGHKTEFDCTGWSNDTCVVSQALPAGSYTGTVYAITKADKTITKRSLAPFTVP